MDMADTDMLVSDNSIGLYGLCIGRGDQTEGMCLSCWTLIQSMTASSTSAYPELRARGVELELRVREIRARYQELDDEIRPLNELVQDKKLTRPSCKELSATYERLSTDFQNFQTRTEQEIALARESAAADVTTSLMKETKSSMSLGVATIESLGQKFDPLKHEAVSQRPSSEHPEGFVSEQFQRGYVVGKRVVRPALVVVSSGPEATAGVSEEEVGVESAKDGAETETDKDQQTGPTVILDRTFQDVYKSISTKGRKLNSRRRKVNLGRAPAREFHLLSDRFTLTFGLIVQDGMEDLEKTSKAFCNTRAAPMIPVEFPSGHFLTLTGSDF
eukprot:750942-Hanusia_phi.AAC.13